MSYKGKTKLFYKISYNWKILKYELIIIYLIPYNLNNHNFFRNNKEI
jgi:hypothetical protein